MMTMEILIEQAESAQRPESTRRRYTSTQRWLRAAKVLRTKGWSWGEIYEWLKSKGEPVQRKKHTFIASMSRSFRRWEGEAAV